MNKCKCESAGSNAFSFPCWLVGSSLPPASSTPHFVFKSNALLTSLILDNFLNPESLICVFHHQCVCVCVCVYVTDNRDFKAAVSLAVNEQNCIGLVEEHCSRSCFSEFGPGHSAAVPTRPIAAFPLSASASRAFSGPGRANIASDLEHQAHRQVLHYKPALKGILCSFLA